MADNGGCFGCAEKLEHPGDKKTIRKRPHSNKANTHRDNVGYVGVRDFSIWPFRVHVNGDRFSVNVSWLRVF